MKKGELTTQQIVGLIILIVSFGIILFLIFRLNLGETTNKEICHNSVVLYSKGKGLAGNLDCSTSYLCVGKNCENFIATSNKEFETKEDVLKIIAQEMQDCWWMFGEGKINFGTIGYSKKCGICSVLKFDLEAQKLSLTYRDLYEYLAKEKISDEKTYLLYLYGINDLSLLENVESFNVDLNKKIDLTSKYDVVVGLDDNFWPQKDSFIPVSFVNIHSFEEKIDCNDILTKA